MKWMGGWSEEDYLSCPLSKREEIFTLMQEEYDESEMLRNR